MRDFRQPAQPSAFVFDVPPAAASSFTPPAAAGFPIGGLVWYAGGPLNIGPEWLLCGGQEELISDYPLLAARLGTLWNLAFGAPSAGHFRMPNLSGRMPIQSQGATFVTGDIGGEKDHTLTAGEVPAHNHPMNPGGFGPLGIIGPGVSGFSGGGSQFTAINTTGNTGGGGAHNNMPPYIVMNAFMRALP